MKNIIMSLFAIVVALPATAVDLYEEVRVGYANDFSFTLGLQLRNLSPDVPVYFSIDGGYIRQIAPGQAEDARAIFINDGTGGNVQEYGESWHYGLLLGYELLDAPGFSLSAVGTVRSNSYSASFAFVGDNEAFRVITNQIGVGGGIATVMGGASDRLRYTLSAMAAYFFPARIDSHGTYYYTPDGVDDRPRNAFTYEDADAAINQPSLRIQAELGILLRLGE